MEFTGFVFLLLGIFLLGWQVVSYHNQLKRKGKSTPSLRVQFGRRLLGLIILFVVSVMTYAGITHLAWFQTKLFLFVVYWGVCLALLVTLLVLAAIDVRATLTQTLRTLDEAAEEKRFREFLEKQFAAEQHKTNLTGKTKA